MAEALSIRIATRLLDNGHPCARMYFVLRGIDKDGCGWVTAPIELLAQLMGVTVRTVQRWFKQGLERGWFREIIGERIYYSAIEKVAASLGVDSLGAISEVELDDIIGRSESKALCTLLEAMYRQNQAYYAARQKESTQGKKRILKPWEIAGSVKSSGSPVIKVISDPFKCPGASIAGIAKATEWSQSTIKRRLSNTWRKERNIEVVTKQRVAISIDDPLLLNEMGEANEAFIITQDNRVLRILNDSGRNHLLQMGCNVYDCGYELLACRWLRGKFKQLANA